MLPPPHSHPRKVRAVALAFLLGILLTGCGGTDTTGARDDRVVRASVADFEKTIGRADVFLLNVHTPDEGSIPGTDAEIAYDKLRSRAARLPDDPQTPIAVYCRTGSMSSVAVPVLRELGYTDVTELTGGMEAWRESGRRLLPP